MESTAPFASSTIVLYDGVCGLCNGIIQFLLPRDRRARYQYAMLQSDFAQEMLRRHGKPTDALDTFFIVLNAGTKQERLLDRSRAAIEVISGLGGAWRLVRALSLIPTVIADPLYGFVARNRYRWSGKSEACLLPRPEWRQRFIA